MKNTLTLSFSIFKANKGFSFGLLLLFWFGVTLVVMSCVLPSTIAYSLDRFVDDYNMWQATIVTEPMQSDVDGLKDIEGVDKIESQMAVETSIKIDEDTNKQMRMFTIEDDGFRKYYFYEKKDVEEGQTSVWITFFLSYAMDLHAGDKIEVNFPDGYKELQIGAVISNPECSSSVYDDTYWCEDFDYGYLYISRSDFDKFYKTSGLSNERSFMFKDGLSVEQKDEAINKACDLLGNNVISTSIFERSKAKTVIDSNKEALFQACELFPYMILVILLVCSSLFLYQTINNQKKKIGLLRALGYSTKMIIGLYIIYILIIFIVALIIGIISALIFDDYVVKEYMLYFAMPEIFYVIPDKTYILILALLITGIFACLISAFGITNIDPSEAYSSTVVTTQPYNFKTPILKHMHVFNKIAIAKLFKNKKKLLMLSFSIAACIILSYMAIANIHSKEKANTATFGPRFSYDLQIYFDDESICDEITSLDEVTKLEKSVVFTERLYRNGKDLTLQYNAIDQDSQLVVPLDINMNRVYSQDGIVLDDFMFKYFDLNLGDTINVDGVDLEIKERACEYVNFIQYISFDTAKKLGYNTSNACFVKLKDNVDLNDMFKKISEMKGFKYMKFLPHQEQQKYQHQRALDLVYYAIIFISIMIGLIIIVNMVAISVQERKFEYGTLIALGTDKSKFISMTLIENLVQYLIAAIVAFVPCYYLAKLVLDSLTAPQQNFVFVDIPDVYIQSFGLALIYIIVGIVYTIFSISKINPATTLNVRG